MISLLCFLLTIFPQMEEVVPDGPFSFVGKEEREIICFDPQNSHLLDQVFEILMDRLTPALSEVEMLALVFEIVRNRVFDPNPNPQDLLPLLEPNCEIPLESFLEKRVGICRHYALTTALLLERLTKVGELDGEVFLIRDETPHGRHGWVLYLSKEAAWNIDPFWGIFENGKSEKGFFHLCRKYGKQTMDRQKTRWTDAS